MCFVSETVQVELKSGRVQAPTARVHGEPMNPTRVDWPSTQEQGRTLVHFCAQRKRCVWDIGCILGLSGGGLGYQALLGGV